MTDDLDRRIRRAVRSLAEAAPPPPTFDGIRPRPGRTATRRAWRPSGRALVGAPVAAVVALVVLLAALGGRTPVDEDVTDLRFDPSQLAGEGVVAPEALLDDELVDIDRAVDVHDPVGEVVVLEVPGGERVAVSAVRLPELSALAESTEQLGGRASTSTSVGGIVPCSSRSAAVAVARHQAIQASGPVDLAVLREVLGSASLAGDGPLVVEGPAGTTEVGRLPAGWRTPVDGSVVRTRVAAVTTVRVGPEEQAALSALRCPVPVRETPPVSGMYPTPDPAEQRPRTILLDGTDVEVGLLDERTQVVVVPTEPGVALLVEADGRTWPFAGDRELARLAASTRSFEDARFDERVAALEEQRIERTRRELAEAGRYVAGGSGDGEPWVLATRDAEPVTSAPGARELCLVEPAVPGEPVDPSLEATAHCVGDDVLRPDLTASTWTSGVSGDRFLFAVVPDGTERLEVRTPDGRVRTGDVVADPVDGFGPVAVVDLQRPLDVRMGTEVRLADGTVEVRALGPAGEELASRSFGPVGCAVRGIEPTCLY